MKRVFLFVCAAESETSTESEGPLGFVSTERGAWFYEDFMRETSETGFATRQEALDALLASLGPVLSGERAEAAETGSEEEAPERPTVFLGPVE